MNKIILLIGLVILLGGGFFFLKRKGNKQQVNIPPVAPAPYTSSWQPPNIGSTIPGLYSSNPAANPGLTQSFSGKTGGCNCGK